jgi:hypothetical protein
MNYHYYGEYRIMIYSNIKQSVLGAILLVFVSSAFADYTTTITSAAYSTASIGTPAGTYTGSMSMSGHIVTKEVVPSATDTWLDFSANVISYSFSDGVQTFTQDNSSLENAESYFDGGFTLIGLGITLLTPTPHSIGTLINVLELEINPYADEALVVGNDIPCTAVLGGICDDGDVDAAAGFADMEGIAISFSSAVTEPEEPTPSVIEIKIHELYVGILGRAADRPGMDYWLDEINSGTLTLENTRASFTHPDQAEYTEIYGGLDNSQLVTATYENFLERAPEFAGLQYWVEELDNSRVNPDQMINAVINAVRDTDATGEQVAKDLATLENKIEAAQYFTAQTQEYSFDAAYREMARAVVASVTDDPETLAQAKAMVDEYVGN